MDDARELKKLIEDMKLNGVKFERGLSDNKIEEIEQVCHFQFPADLRTFLQLGLPLSLKSKKSKRVETPFPNWRKDPETIIRDSRQRVTEVFHFDIEDNRFWMKEWGKPPADLQEALAVADSFLEKAPLLIPICGHRFLPAEPNLPGNPVISMWQATDSIYYGFNLQNYLLNEFIADQPVYGKKSDYRDVPFWSKIVKGEFTHRPIE